MLGHLRRSEIAFPAAAFWRKGTNTSHRGLSQANIVVGWPAEYYWRLESPELQLLCERWHCHDGAVDNGHPFGHAIYTMPGDFRQTVADILHSRKSFCPQAVWWQLGRILQRNTLSFDWKHFCFYWISQVSSHLGRPIPPTVASGSYWYTQVKPPVTTSQTWGDFPPWNFMSMWFYQST